MYSYFDGVLMKKLIFLPIFLMISGLLFSQESQTELYTAKQQQLRIRAENVCLIPDTKKGGYHLYVKKTPNVNSILLTETTKDPDGKNDSYAYWALRALSAHKHWRS
jgi:hypothetical protein